MLLFVCLVTALATIVPDRILNHLIDTIVVHASVYKRLNHIKTSAHVEVWMNIGGEEQTKWASVGNSR